MPPQQPAPQQPPQGYQQGVPPQAPQQPAAAIAGGVQPMAVPPGTTPETAAQMARLTGQPVRLDDGTIVPVPPQ
jgi:hypothetical protein